MNKINTSAISIILLIRFLESYGFDYRKIAYECGISINQFNNPEPSISLDSFIKLWDLAVKVSGDEALALHLRQNTAINHFVVLIAINSSTIAEGISNYIKYEKLICEANEMHLIEDDEFYHLTFVNMSPPHECRYIPEYTFCTAINYARELTGREPRFYEVWFKHNETSYIDEYKRIFKCRVLFNQIENKIIFTKEQLDCPLAKPDRYIQSIMKKHAETIKHSMIDKEYYECKVKNYIIRNLSSGKVDNLTISNALNMDRTTLHRYLKKEGSSFSKILRDVRKEYAHQYLKQDLNGNQIAYLLGFSESSAFQRAFKSWFGKNPGEYKKDMEKTS